MVFSRKTLGKTATKVYITWTGRAGPICRRAFARLCKRKVNGTYSFWNPAGRPEGKRPEAIVNAKVRKAVLSNRPADLSKTAGAKARAKA